MTAYLRALTPRGRILLVLGVVGAAVAWGIGQPAVVAVAVLLLLLPVLGLVAVHRARFLLGSSRSVSSPELAFGDDGEVQLTIENGSRLPTGVLVLEDRVPTALGEPTRVLLDRVQPRSRRTVRYAVHGRRRGLARLGPLTVLLTDPFGMARREQDFTTTTGLLVAPRIVPLRATLTGTASAGGGDTRLRAIAARGDDDVLPREHRPGDEVRRIHWRATARQGSLMVRREEVSRHSAITVVLDDRAQAHEGIAAASSFEWAVSAAASIAVHHCRRGWHVLVVTATGLVLAEVSGAATMGSVPRAGQGSAEVQALLRAFAEIECRDATMSERSVLATSAATSGARPWTSAATSGARPWTSAATALVAVMGHLGEDGMRAMARPVAGWSACLAMEAAPLDTLRASGWRATGWTRSTPVDEAWMRLTSVAMAAAR